MRAALVTHLDTTNPYEDANDVQAVCWPGGAARHSRDNPRSRHGIERAEIAPAMISMAAPFRQIRLENIPAPQHFQARDDVGLQYYAYPARLDQVAVLIHSSVGPGVSMHALAKALRAASVTAYVLDIRGRGGSGRRGDIDYIGQIDDDLADFIGHLGSAKSDESRTLVGFSAGAGFTIRFAAVPMACCLTAMCFCRQSCRGRRPCVRTPAVGRTLRSRAL